MTIQAPKGTKDVLPKESYKWHFIEQKIRRISDNNGYREIRTPIFEDTNLFERGVGETTDIVQKEMYTFIDKGERSITLKPEGTAPTVRAFIEHSMHNDPQPTKMYYLIPCFRYEKPQSGRLREFHQFGVEAFGSNSAAIDAEVINIAMTLFKDLTIKNLQLRINSVGCPTCRKEYNEKLKKYLQPKLADLCELCNDRFNKNPLRIIDCKEEKCKKQITDIPYMIDSLCEDCSSHFDELKKVLNVIGLEYVIDPTIVRGLDYYTKTAFEIVSQDIGSQGTVCGGGRYDGLIEDCGGTPTPGVGFGLGLERLLLVMESQGIEIKEPRLMDIYIASMGEAAHYEALNFVHKLRNNGIKAETDYMGKSVKAQMKYANKMNAKFSAVLGDNEIIEKQLKLKNMDNGSEEIISFNDLVSVLINKIQEEI